MSNELPEGYKKGVARVSSIVSHKYPFDGTYGHEAYLKWLYNSIKDDVEFIGQYDDKKFKKVRKFFPELEPLEEIMECDDRYMAEACDVGTFIHLQMELHSLGKKTQKKDVLHIKHLEEIKGGIKYIDELTKKYPDVKWVPEQVVIDEELRFQGTIDLIRIDEKNKKVWLYDWKTFGIAKKKWGLNNKYKKPSGKLPKVGLQMSLYAETYRQKGYEIGGVYCLYLHSSGCYEYECEIATSAEINELLLSYKENENRTRELKKITNNYKNMSFDLPFKLEILEPTKQFGNVKLNLDLGAVDNGKTDQENVDELAKKAKYIASKMK